MPSLLEFGSRDGLANAVTVAEKGSNNLPACRQKSLLEIIKEYENKITTLLARDTEVTAMSKHHMPTQHQNQQVVDRNAAAELFIH